MMSSAIERDDMRAVAPRAGGDLRAARERVGRTLQDMAAALRIRLQYLEALEAGQLGALPGNTYALGFLRTYSNALGLDSNEIARRFRAEAGEVNQKTQLTFPAPVPERGVPAGAVVLLGVLLAVGTYAGWYQLSGEGKLPAETSTQVPVRLAPLADQAVPMKPQPSLPTAVAVPPPTLEPAPVRQAEAPTVPAISPGSAAAAPVPLLPVPPAPIEMADQTRILLRVTADAWIQVRDRAGQVLLNRILHSGETWPVPAKGNLLLTTGNAGGTDLLVDGVVSPSLGGNGAVRRDLLLDPGLIKDGRLAWGQPIVGATQQANTRSNPQ